MRAHRLVPILIAILLYSSTTLAMWSDWVEFRELGIEVQISSNPQGKDNFIHYIQLKNDNNRPINATCTVDSNVIEMRPSIWRFSLGAGQVSNTGGMEWMDSHDDVDYNVSCQVK
jgi:hypothetical protein